MVAYADTSFLVSLYGQDANSAAACRIARGCRSALPLTSLQAHETRNAFRLAVFRKVITEAECRHVLHAFEDDLRTGVLEARPVIWTDLFDEAERLSVAYTPTLGVRAADILHVAAARIMNATAFLTFDERQRALALKARLRVLP